MFRRSSRAQLAIALTLAAGCGERALSNDTGFTVRDSAGIRIVENASYAWGDGEVWRIADTPDLDIGVVEGDSVYQLFRVSGALRLDDGRIAISNAGTQEVRFFDREGRFLSAIGGEGEGPGEFRSLQSLFPFRGDSLLAWDARLQRVSLLTPEGSMGRVARVEGQAMNPRLLHPFADGSFLRLDEHFEISEPGPQQQIMVPTLHDASGAVVDSLGELPFMKTVRIGSGPEMMVGSPGFSRYTAVVVTDDRYYVGLGAATEIEVRSPTDGIVGLLRWPDHERAVTAGDIETYRAEAVEGIQDENRRRQQRTYFETIPYESEFPAYRRIIADRPGNLWVEGFPRPGAAGPRPWLVIDTAGRSLGEVQVPEGLRMLDIGEDYLLAVEEDELDVEHVRLYPLIKPARN